MLVPPDADCHARRAELELLLAERFGLEHTTLQVEHESDGGLLDITPAVASKAMDAPPPIPELERLVMEEIWTQGEATVRSVRDALNADAGQPRARLHDRASRSSSGSTRRALVVRSRDGQTDVFTAALSREEYLGARADAEVSELLEQYGELALVQFARRMAALDPQRRDALRRLAGE